MSTFDPFNLYNGQDGVFVGEDEGIWAINTFGTTEDNVVVYFSRIGSSISSVWSIQLDANGEFIGQENFCFDIGTSFPISDLILDDEQNIYLATRNQNGYYPGAGYSSLENNSANGFKYSFNGVSWVSIMAYLTLVKQIHVQVVSH